MTEVLMFLGVFSFLLFGLATGILCLRSTWTVNWT
uniref:Uncharacterized protein n=1 Tax=Arundo donax TaxID=35708 RepID=A0A0A9GJX3_ARUDO